MGSPWSAPAWMKTNNNLIGGSLSDSYVNTYADYLVKFVQAYQGAGAPVAYLSVQNEPQFSPPGYPGMLMSAAQQAAIINALVPKLRAAGLGTQTAGLGPQLGQHVVRPAGQQQRRQQRDRVRLALLRRQPERPVHGAQRPAVEGHLLHRVLRHRVRQHLRRLAAPGRAATWPSAPPATGPAR